MPRETLRALSGDIERLLQSGASAAASDAELGARRDALQRFGQSAPALLKVAEQVARVLGAKPREAAGELLNLAAVDVQLRGAQAAARDAEGELRALPAAEPVETPLAFGRVSSIGAALAGTSDAPAKQVLEDALERGEVVDLRLMPGWIAALASNALGELATSAVPRFGRAVLGPLRARLALDGGAHEARVLRCLALVEPRDAALALLRKALAEGSSQLRAAALEVLHTVDPAECERAAVPLLSADRSADVRAAAAQVLAGTRDEGAVDALFKALDDVQSVQQAAFDALGKTSHPTMAPRLLAALTPASLKIPAYRWKAIRNRKRLTPAKLKAAQQKQRDDQQAYNTRVTRAWRGLVLLGHLNDPAGNKLLRATLKSNSNMTLRQHAGNALASSPDPAQREVAMELMWSPKYQLKNIGWSAFFADKATVFERAAPYFTANAFKGPKGSARAVEFLHRMRAQRDLPDTDRWCERCVGLLKRARVGPLAAVYLLQHRHEPALAEALPIAMKATSSGWTLPGILGEWRHPLCLAALRTLWKRKGSNKTNLAHALAAHGDPADLALLRDELEKLKKSKKKYKPTWQINKLEESIRVLEQNAARA